MIGDGWQRKYGKQYNYGVCFGKDEEYACNEVFKVLENIYYNSSKHKNHTKPNTHNISVRTDKNNGVMSICFGKQSMIKYFKEKYGFEEKLSINKNISKKIKYSKPNQIASFLSGLFSADGTVYHNKNRREVDFSVNYTSASLELLYDVQTLLRPFGIHGKVRYGEVKCRKGRYCGNLCISGKENIEKFYKYINFKLCPNKMKKLCYAINNTNYKNEIKLEWTKIKNISYIGKEQVYDLNVKNTHHFVSSGVISHNCNLSSICLPSFIKEENGKKYYDFDLLHRVSKIIAKNIDNIIDMNFYPVKKAETSNLRHRPTGIGVQGLADTFAIMKYPYDSEEARELNKRIFETIYHGALEQSMETAKERYYAIISGKYELLNDHEKHLLGSKFPGSYSSFEGSPMSKGLFQFDLWGHKQINDRYDWDKLRNDVMKYGLRNSLLTSLMPTASTSQIMGFNESFEPFTSNFYKRKTLAGEFICVNKYLIADLVKLGLWDNDMKENIIINEGSIKHIDVIPKDIKELYKTSWDISQKAIIDLAADRGRYICQSQSMNLFLEEPSYQKLTSMHFYTWKKGLKTGIYYLRTKPRANPIMFSVDPTKINKKEQQNNESDEETCTMCSG
jgi:hypothetical protein